MNLLIVDADSRYSYTSEELSSLLGNEKLTIWYLDDKKLAEEEYSLETVAEVSGDFTRVILLTKASHGFMKYHREMVRNNPSVKYWVITLPNTVFAAEQQQIVEEISEIFQQQNVQYAVLFDDPETLKETAAVLKETIPDRPQCILYFSKETPVAEHIMKTLKTDNSEWDVLSNPENTEWVEKYADRILIFAEDLEEFRFLAKINNSDRIYVWTEIEPGTVDQQKENIVNQISHLMEECGFSLTKEEEHILCGFSQYELFHAEIKSGAYTYTALRNNDLFVMWDEYGLPLLNRQYEDTNMKLFLDAHCVLTGFMGN